MSRIRPVEPGDGPAVREIQSRVIAEPWPALLETALDGPLSLFVLDDGGPIGYAIVVPGADGVVYVPELAVHPDRQREGHGSRLLSALCGRFADHEEMRLTVRETDQGARRFYERHGFARIDRVEDHFESGDGLLLSRPLDENSTRPDQ
jgi:ribosomal-protein-alanine N-acetyltransferase